MDFIYVNWRFTSEKWSYGNALVAKKTIYANNAVEAINIFRQDNKIMSPSFIIISQCYLTLSLLHFYYKKN